MKGIVQILEVILVGMILLMAFVHFFPQYYIKTNWDKVLLGIKTRDTLSVIDSLDKTYDFSTNKQEFENFMSNVFPSSGSGDLIIYWREFDDNLGLLGYWKFDEGSGSVSLDYSGNLNNGTLRGSPNWIAGKFGNALHFDSDNDYFDPDSDIDLGNNWTIATWFYYPIEDSGHWRTLTRGAGGDHQVIVELGSYDLGSYDNTGGTGFYDCGYNVNVLSNGWHHLAAVQKGGTTGKIEFYIDALKVCGSNGYGSISDITAIGNSYGGDQEWGRLDEFRIYGRALSEQEILYLNNTNKFVQSVPKFTSSYKKSMVDVAIDHGNFRVYKFTLGLAYPY